MQTMKRSLSMFMVLVMLIAFVPALSLGASAAEVDYKYSGSYIYNWGTRGTTATFLSPNAEDFYEDNNTSYDELSSLSGGTGKSDAPKSEMYRELQSLMKSNHSHTNSYKDNNSLLKYTDCQNGGGAISSFYSGKSIGPNWDSGSTWNKEHTWPNSKGLGGSDEDDVMMIRPTSSSENSSRGNTAYGKSSGYYNPNKESGGKYDLRGDVARIFLYVYVRWGNTSYAWGTSGVMESVDVLLEWMEADPVDTWELGRNDSVESITGTRNVFVDYPELAFILFGEEIPADMTTPSGEAAGATKDCGHNNFGSGVVTLPTCTEKGYTTFTCLTVGCGYSYKDSYTNSNGHSYSNGVCSACGEAETVKPTYTTTPEIGKAYKLGLFSTTEYFFTGSMVSTYYGASDTDYAKGVDVYLEQANGGYYLYFKNSSGQKQYINIVASNDYRNFSYSSTATSVFVWDTAKNTLKTTVAGEYCYIGNFGSHSSMNGLKESNLKDTDYLARLYTMDGESGGNPSDNPTIPPEETTPNIPDTPVTPNTPTPPVSGPVTASKTVADLITEYGWTGTTVKQKFNLDANVTVKINGGDNSGKAYNNDHIRIYATDSPAGTVTITLADGYELVSVKVSTQTGTYAHLCLDGTTTDICNESISVSGSSVVLNTVKNGSNGKHVRITAIEVVYNSLSATPDIPEESTPDETTPEVTIPEETTPESEINYGTLNTPVTVTYAYNACANLANGKSSADAFYVKGTVTAIGTTGSHYKNVYFTDGTTEMLIYTINMSDGITGFEVGDTIVAYGYIKNYNGTIEMATYNGSVYVYVVRVEYGNPDQGDVTTPEETTPEVTTPEVTTPEETTPEGTTPEESTPEESTPEESTPEESTPEESTPEESTPAEPETPEDDSATEEEKHVCEEVNGFKKFINAIINFFRKLFGQPELCPCGKTTIEE